MNINCWHGCGRLTRDTELRSTKNGSPMSKFRMAINDRREDDTVYVDVLCFGKTAEALTKYLKKGTLVGVRGKMKLDQYQTDDGEHRASLKRIADQIELGPRNGSEELLVETVEA